MVDANSLEALSAQATVESPETVEFSIEKATRDEIVRAGLTSFGENDLEEALSYFGAAIRKVAHWDLRDVEASFFKFLTLYRLGRYSGAVGRCFECIDAVHEVTKSATRVGVKLPHADIVAILDRCLVPALIKRGDGWLNLLLHFWKRPFGDRLAQKRTVGFWRALVLSIQAFRDDGDIMWDQMESYLPKFTLFLNMQIEARETTGNSEAVKVTAPSTADAPPATPAAEASGEQFTNDPPAADGRFLASVAGKNFSELSEDEVSELGQACRLISTQEELGIVTEIIRYLRPQTRHPFIAALALSPLFQNAIDQAEVETTIARNVIDYRWKNNLSKTGRTFEKKPARLN